MARSIYRQVQEGEWTSAYRESVVLRLSIYLHSTFLAGRTDEISSKNRSPTPSLSSLPEDAPHAKILRLLRVLHKINVLEAERTIFIGEKRNVPEAAFVNNKLSAKLTRQLEEPMIVARYGCLTYAFVDA